MFEEVVDRFREAIFSGYFQPGEKLPTERELAQRLNVSRAAVREAMRVLELSGLVVVRHGGPAGLYVAQRPARPVGLALNTLLKHGQFTLQELCEALAFFQEPMAREVAVRATADDVAALEANLESARQSLEDPSRVLHEVTDFHLLLADILHNRVIEEIMGALYELTRAETDLESVEASFHATILREHQEIFRAIRERNPNKAGRAMATHFKTLETMLLKEQIWLGQTASPATA